jgi:peptidoglycan/LPS O-acetylase OafA/YrhL
LPGKSRSGTGRPIGDALANAALVVVSVAVMLVAAELFFRVVDGYSVRRLRAWAVFLGVLPDVRHEIGMKALPKPARFLYTRHPHLTPARSVDVPCPVK